MKRSIASLSVVLALVATPAFATDGYFQHGYGLQADGRGGTAIAVGHDVFAGANNPATLLAAGSRIEFGLAAFRPERSASRTGLGPGLDGSAKSGHDLFAIPEFGYSHLVGDQLALGVAVYGNGGMNTDYPTGQLNCGRGPANLLCGSTGLGVNLMQVFIAPTLAYQLTPNQALGVAPLLAFQRFTAKGLQAFAGTPGVSSAPGAVTNQGADYSHGVGYRLGYHAKLGQHFALGAAYSGKLHMSRFKKYAGLFAGQGGFDIPENYALGIAFYPDNQWTLALDYQRINYADVPSVGNSSRVRGQLGADNGPGFGWHDVNVWKLGVEYAASARWTLRAGFNHSSDPIRSQDVTFNILAPGVVMNHATAGVTYRFARNGELTLAYMHAFKHANTGTSILPAFMGGMPAGQERVSMYEDELGVAFAWRL